MMQHDYYTTHANMISGSSMNSDLHSPFGPTAGSLTPSSSSSSSSSSTHYCRKKLEFAQNTANIVETSPSFAVTAAATTAAVAVTTSASAKATKTTRALKGEGKIRKPRKNAASSLVSAVLASSTTTTTTPTTASVATYSHLAEPRPSDDRLGSNSIISSSGKAEKMPAKLPSNTKRNARERKRVRTINDYFNKLQKYLPFSKLATNIRQQQQQQQQDNQQPPGHKMPTINASKRLSKVETLKAAIEYIEYLQVYLPPPVDRVAFVSRQQRASYSADNDDDDGDDDSDDDDNDDFDDDNNDDDDDDNSSSHMQPTKAKRKSKSVATAVKVEAIASQVAQSAPATTATTTSTIAPAVNSFASSPSSSFSSSSSYSSSSCSSSSSPFSSLLSSPAAAAHHQQHQQQHTPAASYMSPTHCLSTKFASIATTSNHNIHKSPSIYTNNTYYQQQQPQLNQQHGSFYDQSTTLIAPPATSTTTATTFIDSQVCSNIKLETANSILNPIDCNVNKTSACYNNATSSSSLDNTITPNTAHVMYYNNNPEFSASTLHAYGQQQQQQQHSSCNMVRFDSPANSSSDSPYFANHNNSHRTIAPNHHHYQHHHHHHHTDVNATNATAYLSADMQTHQSYDFTNFDCAQK